MLADLTIDQALFNAALTTSPPALVRPYFDFADKEEAFLAENRARLAATLEDVKAFEERGEIARRGLEQAFSTNLVEAHHIENLSAMISVIEQKAELLSDELQGIFKRGKGMFKQLEAYFSEDGRKALRALHEGMIASSRREIDEHSNMALFMRALRAEYDPQNPTIGSFSDAKELGAYLNTLIA
ncbi:hypothetical protein [Agrobacterium sp. MS2]|uniref:hypothetical protein n=1 Tax=Agrobacterium sp. MS2 TaxID=1345498 RepID=UPI000DB0D052|nr:hypothetical protein [Agrobacterium sp. MS2]PZP59497.1 MAG: hypothetical protein DI604_32335 [Delftia acidovorans]RAL95620.1 hypothetical protein DOU54_20915 [Agrobacterium sp. MS2]